ncbi:hypothetical protein NA57DRAFT_10014, partial [Rhizodiscina lignyota]
ATEQPTRNRQQGTIGRRKSRQACDACRKQKRKCIGREPCYSCLRYEYECVFTPSRKSVHPSNHITPPENSPNVKQITPPAAPSEANPSGSTTVESSIGPWMPSEPAPVQNHVQIKRRPIIVPSGSNFIKRLANQLSKKPYYSTLGDSWNLGLRRTAFDRSITSLTSQVEVQKYSSVYFTKIHPVYSIIDPIRFRQQLHTRWNGSSTEYDTVLCGVVALGSLFSGTEALGTEPEIVELAKSMLESWTPVDSTSPVSHDIASAWILQVLYLRMAVDPHSTWIATHSSISAIEGDAGSCRSSIALKCDDPHKASLHAKLHWVARLLNTWICNEYDPSPSSRSFVSIPCPPPLSSNDSNDYTPLLVSIYRIGLQMCNVAERKSMEELTALLGEISRLPTDVHDVIQLHKSCHAFCVYRFMRLTTAVIPRPTLSLIIELGRPGLEAALRLAEDGQPWWHVVHVPFQFLCMLLSMDTHESLSHIEWIMGALRRIEQCFQTPTMQKVISMAENLVR